MVYIIYVFEYLMAPRPPPPLPPPPPLQALPLPHAAAVMSVPSHPQPPGVWDHPIPRPWSSSCTHRRCSVSRASRSPGGRQPPDPAAPAPTVDGSEPSAASHGRCMACRRGQHLCPPLPSRRFRRHIHHVCGHSESLTGPARPCPHHSRGRPGRLRASVLRGCCSMVALISSMCIASYCG
jgi:hypothetical protein